MYWIISDTHFLHQNIIYHCHRPFINYKDMDDTIINNINSLVKENDTLYHLGDWSFGRNCNLDTIIDTRARIKCKDIRLVYGNHDKLIRKKYVLQKLFTSCEDYYLLNIDNKHILLTHYLNSLNNFIAKVINKFHINYPDGIHLFGHHHNNENVTPYNMCVENHNYKPVLLDNIIKEY